MPVLRCLCLLGSACCTLSLLLGMASLYMQCLYAFMKNDKDCNSKVSAGKVLNYAGVSVLTPAEMSASARRVLRFIDLGGHEKYLKTALYGMTCMVTNFPNCPCMLFGLQSCHHILAVGQPKCPSPFVSSVCLSHCLSVCLPVPQSVSLSMCVSVCLSVCLCMRLFTCLSAHQSKQSYHAPSPVASTAADKPSTGMHESMFAHLN